MQSRREFLKAVFSGVVCSALPLGACRGVAKERPNVVVILTDDQGYGDFGATGNPVIRTPHLDALAQASAQMTNFYVSPVCAPTRACLMTGRYNYRTRAIDTFVGRAMMDPAEVTIAELLKLQGYATGIFGKWHLGDNYPLRPQEQGFEEVLVHRGGGIGQPSDPPGGEGKYTDPILFHNGKEVQMKGYCTDIYFDGAIAHMRKAKKAGRPFFVYLATNLPHTPLHDVPADLYEEYKTQDLSNARFPQEVGHPLNHRANTDNLARIYAMVTNIDQNVGRLVAELKRLGVEKNTLMLFMVDNGPQGRRYVAGLKGAKGTIYEGGIRSPLFAYWPSVLEAGHKSDRVTAHIDVLPTILEACGVRAPEDLRLDGRSFWRLLKGEAADWPDRHIVIQAQRGDRPVRYHNFVIRTQDWKLLHNSGFGPESFTGQPHFELYDMRNDPFEMNNVAVNYPEKVAELRKAYDAWFDDVSSTRPDNYDPPRIYIGTPHENPVVLTRQDWRHKVGQPWGGDSNGEWVLYVADPGPYAVVVRLRAEKRDGHVVLEVGDFRQQKACSAGQTSVTFEDVRLKVGNATLRAIVTTPDKQKGPWQVDVIRK